MTDPNKLAGEIVREVLMDASPAILIAEQKGADRNIIDVNDVFLDLLGYDRSDLIGRTPRTLLCPAENDYQQVASMNHRLDTFGVCEGVLSVRSAKGPGLPMSVQIVSRVEPGGVQTLVYLCRPTDSPEFDFKKTLYDNGLLSRAEKVANAGAWKISVADRGLSYSDNLLTLIGASPEDNIQKLAPRCVSPATLRRIWRAAWRCDYQGVPFELDFDFKRKDGEQRTGRISGQPDTYYMEQSTGVVGVLLDTTEVSRARQKGEDAEAEHRDTMELVEVGLFTREIKTGDVRFNRLAAEIIGLDQESRFLTTAELSALVHADDFADLEANFRRRCKSDETLESQVRIRGKDGEYRWFSVRSRGVLEADGSVVLSRGTIANIDHVKNTESALDSLQTQFQKAISATGVGIVHLADGVCQCSREIAVMLQMGDQAFEVDKNIWRARIHPDDQETAKAPFRGQDGLSIGDLVTTQYRMRRESGDYFWIESRMEVDALAPDGAISGFSGVVIDIDERVQAEIEFRRLQMKLDVGVRAARIGLFEIDHESRAVNFSTEIAQILGRPAEAFTESIDWWIEQIHPDDRAHVHAAGCRHYDAAEPFCIEYRLKRSDGEYVWVEARSTFEKDKNGKPILLQGALISIDERKTTELALKRLEALFDIAAKSAKVGVYEGDLGEGKTAYSASVARILGLPEKNLIQPKSWWRERVHPDDLQTYDEYARLREETDGQVTLDHRVRREDGSYIWVEARTTLHVSETGGKPHIVGAILDIDDRKRAELQLNELSERFDWARAAARVGLWSWNAETDEAIWSPECVELLKLPPGTAFELKTVMDHAHPDDKDQAWSVIKNVMLNGEDTFTNRFRYIAPDGEILWLETIGRATHDQTGPVSIFGSLRDVTHEAERALALEHARDAAEEAAAAKASFLATMSHEIRTPLNAVIGMTSLLMRTDLQPSQREYAETANTAGEHLLCLVNDVLDLTKLEADRVELDSTAFDLCEEIHRVAAMMRPVAREKSLDLMLSLGGGLAGSYEGDPARLRQILLNLIGNAVKFTEAGEIRIAAAKTMEDRIRISVSDTGIGISEKAQRRLFDDFVQADAGINRRYGGTGLGLSICRRLVGLMDGEIGVESQPGEGSVFWFELPLKEISDHRSDNADDLASATDGLRILAADDNAANRLLLETILHQFGCNATVVEDGRQAADAAAGTAFDILILDVEMPNLDGIGAVADIRSRQGPNSRKPILALTAHSGRRSELIRAGFDDALSKPFSATALAALLMKLSGAGETEDAYSQNRETSIMSDYAAAPLVNQSTLEPLLNAAGPDVVRSIIDAFCEQADGLVDAIDNAVSSADQDQIRKTSHELKGCAANVGAGRVSAIASDMEHKPAAEAAQMMPELKEAMAKTRPALKNFVRDAA